MTAVEKSAQIRVKGTHIRLGFSVKKILYSVLKLEEETVKWHSTISEQKSAPLFTTQSREEENRKRLNERSIEREAKSGVEGERIS